jgi:hypothetical protein
VGLGALREAIRSVRWFRSLTRCRAFRIFLGTRVVGVVWNDRKVEGPADEDDAKEWLSA